MDRVEINPEVMGGKPVIRGTRVTVEVILRMLAQRISEEEILSEYPRLVADDIGAARRRASSRSRRPSQAVG